MYSGRLGQVSRWAAFVLGAVLISAAWPRAGPGQPTPVPSRGVRRPMLTSHQALLSPSVEATWVVRDSRLSLLILWRGHPGWFQRQPGGFVDKDGEQLLVRGTIRLSQRYDDRQSVVYIQGRRTELGADNVVFVDEVDGINGPRVIGHLRIDPAMSGSAAQIGPMLARSAPIMAFMRCDVLRPGLEGEAWLRRLCLETIGVAK